MASFDFSQSNGTTLEVIDSRWEGDTATLVTNGGNLSPSAAFGGGIAYFVNGQGDTQESQATVNAFTASGGEAVALYLQRNATQVGYRAYQRADGQVDMERNGAFLNRVGPAAGVNLATTALVLRMSYNHTTGVLTIRQNGTVIGTYTDGTPLTGGYPGLLLFAGSSAGSPSLADWTDLYVPPAAVLSSPGRDTVADVSVRVTASSTVGVGTFYAAITPTSTPPTAAQIKAGTGGGIVAAGSSALAAGANAVTVSGLTPSTTYFAHAVANNGTDSNVVTTTSFTTTPPAPGVSTLSGTPTHGSSLTITGTNFNATQSGGTVVLGGVAQTVTAWSATSITITVSRGTNRYGVALNLVVTNGVTGLASSPYAVGAGVAPPAGWAYVNVVTPNATAANRLTASPTDIVSGDQIAWQTQSNTVTVYTDATFSAVAATASFSFEVWTNPDGWGAAGVQTIGSAAPAGAAKLVGVLAVF